MIHQQPNRDRVEIRTLDCLGVPPGPVGFPVGFPGAQLAARLERRVRRKGQRTCTVVYLLSSRTLEELQAQELLALKRGYWVIESRLHHCLDITMQEDLSRVRTPNSARVLGMIRRVVLSLANAAVDRARKANPKTKANTKSFRQRFRSSRGGRERLQALIFAKVSDVLDFTK